MKMKTKELVELRKIKNGQLFRHPATNSLYVRGDYSPLLRSFYCHQFDSLGVEGVLSGDTLVYRVSIVEF